MKKRIGMLLAAALAIPLVSLGMVIAESTTPTSPPTTSDNDTEAMKTRVEKLKTDFKIKLTTAETARIKLKCKAAQGLVTTLDARVKEIKSNREQAHKAIVDKLNELVTKLKAKNVDTTMLETDIVMLQSKITTFQTDLSAYDQDLADLAKLDCNSDPAAFKAALEAARAARVKVGQDAMDIRGYITGVIKPLLQTIRASLMTDSSNSGGSN